MDDTDAAGVRVDVTPTAAPRGAWPVVFFRPTRPATLPMALRGRVRQQRHMCDVLAAADDAVLALDAQRRVTLFNRAAEEIFGYRAREVLGQPVDVFLADRYGVPRGKSYPVARSDGSAMVTGRGQRGVGRRHDGSEFPAELTVSTLSARGYVVLIRDITERVHAEERERKIELMRRADALKDQIINTLSHELRTPISVIAGFTNILQERLAGPLTDDQDRYLDQIQAESEHLLKLINDLLELTQIQAGKLILDLHPVHLGEVVKDVLTQVMPLAQRKRQQIQEEIAAELPMVQADDARIAQVLGHLLLNAIKFAPEGTAIAIRARVDNGVLRCEVEDAGLCISEDDVPKLFQRFTQLDMSTTRRFGGVGIGLFISKTLIEAHRGAIGLGCRQGRGNTFWFTLPLDG